MEQLSGSGGPDGGDGRRPVMLSVIVPCYNEIEVIGETHRRLSRCLDAITADWEIVYVDDGSRDGTVEALTDLARTEPRLLVVRLARNFGHQIAVSAGFDHVRGAAVVIIDADLQDPPEVIAGMVELWEQGADVVLGRRESREGESWFKLKTASYFYRILNRISDVAIPLDVGDFRLIDRAVLDVLRAMPERHRLLRAMTSWVGFRQVEMPYHRAARFAGTTKYPLKKMLRLSLDGLLSFSTVPLKMIGALGFALATLAVLGIVYALVLRLFTSNWVPGFTLLFVAMLLIGGLQFISLSVIGAYIGRVYSEAKQRPLYVVAERIPGGSPPTPRRRGRQAVPVVPAATGGGVRS
jgi:dolichol-phosphate mannosyltransferase